MNDLAIAKSDINPTKVYSVSTEDVTLLEDVCEGLGSKYKNQNLGTFGLASYFSLYFGHHLSTIEGGFINTNDEEYYNLLVSIRSHGWDRDLKKIIANQKKTEPKKVFPKKRKRKEPKKVLPKEKIDEDGDTMTYEQYLKLHNLRDFTKKK